MKRRMCKPLLSVFIAFIMVLPFVSPFSVGADEEYTAVEIIPEETRQEWDGVDEAVRLAIENSETVTENTVKAEQVPQITAAYADENGIVYQWNGYEDGTAEIFEFGYDGGNIVVDIPAEIDGYTVTKLTGKIQGETIDVLSIPETITYFGKDIFANDTIKKLYFNAVDAKNNCRFFDCPFAYSEVYELTFGKGVRVIEDYTFYQTIFHQDQVDVHVPVIKPYAFHSAVFDSLVLADGIEEIHREAFEQAQIGYLDYECADAELVGLEDMLCSPFRSAVIKDLKISGEMTEIPDYFFANAHFQMKEYVADQQKIGRMAFFHVWDTAGFWEGTDMVSRLTISEDVEFVGEEAFGQCWIEELVWNAEEVGTDACDVTMGLFNSAKIYGLEIGKGVQRLPDYCFANADLNFKKFTADTPKLGTCCFYHAWALDDTDNTPVEMNVTDRVEMIGRKAFGDCLIDSLQYASNAELEAEDTLTGPFSMAKIHSLDIGKNVTEIKPYLFAETGFENNISLKIDVPVGDYAFYVMYAGHNGFSNLVMGA